MQKTSNPIETERSRMLRGEFYSAMDPELVAARVRARRLFARYNASDPADSTGRAALLRENETRSRGVYHRNYQVAGRRETGT
jgi:hypothetical protein